jgi:hypothetical protein
MTINIMRPAFRTDGMNVLPVIGSPSFSLDLNPSSPSIPPSEDRSLTGQVDRLIIPRGKIICLVSFSNKFFIRTSDRIFEKTRIIVVEASTRERGNICGSSYF